MLTVEAEVLKLGPQSNGLLMNPWEFDAAEFEPGWRYELINGVLSVNPPPSLKERDPNEELGHWLRNYQKSHTTSLLPGFKLPLAALLELMDRWGEETPP